MTENEKLKVIREKTKLPIKTDAEIQRVEIVILKYKEDPKVINECVSRIIHNTEWPFKLNIFDNRMNPANFSKIWNQIIRDSVCDYVLIMDSDAFVPLTGPCWLTRMMSSIEETGVVVPMGPEVGGENRAEHPAAYPNARRQQAIWSGFVALYAKRIFDRVGWFDEDFHIYGQDSEFAFRVLKKLGGAVYRTDVFVEHIGGHSTRQADSQQEIDREMEKIYSNSVYRLKTQGKI